MPTDQYLKAFAEGPCAPAVILPGITGTSLRAIIDCETLQAANHELFKTCGWDSCKNGIFHHRPDKEYRAFIPGLISPLSLVGNDQQKLCFVGIFTLRYRIENGEYLPQEQPGVKIRPVGETPETVSNSDCGFGGITNLIPLKF